MRDKPSSSSDHSRRNFLQTLGVGVPTLKLMLEGTRALASPPGDSSDMEVNPEKFKPIRLDSYFTASPRDFGPNEHARVPGGSPDGLVRTPTGDQSLRGIPFLLGPEGADRKCWIALNTRESPWTTRSIEIPLGHEAGFICLAAFCDWDANENPPRGSDARERVGQLLADAVLVDVDGKEKSFPFRRRFEVNSPTVPWGHMSFASLPYRADAPGNLFAPLASGKHWGENQASVWGVSDRGRDFEDGIGNIWLSALENPNRNRPLKILRLNARSEDLLMICGLTLFHGRENPLRLKRLSLYRISLPEAAAEEEGRWKVNVDLGVVARTYVLSDFQPEAWLTAPDVGSGEFSGSVHDGRYLYAEVTASPEATMVLADAKTGKNYSFDLGQAPSGNELEARPQGARVEILEREKVWLHAQAIDSATHRPTPVRLSFRSKEGRYIPPYGHRTEVDDAWFQDYGADLKLGDASFAYVDGVFQVELPVGDVYVEMTKGFEYAPVRKKLSIEPHQRELTLEISKSLDLRSKGWVTADTHVHFLSPPTAVLEGQAEGLNLISLYAAQWGDLFTNVGDLPYGPLISQDGETMVQVSTENRQHILGHLGLVGGHGPAAFPMSASGPSESYLGDPLRVSLADWADMEREREGLVVAVHFPYPTAELAADIVLGKIDVVELRPYTEYFNILCILDWYRYLNCGYRLPAVGGTDKMGAYMAVGCNRTYAYLGQEEFNFVNWKKAVLRGNTFATTGPLLLFHADGHVPGEEITLGAGGGTVEVRAEAKCSTPIHLLEIVLNGKVVASREEKGGSQELSLHESVHVPGPGWLAARCSRLGFKNTYGSAAHTSPVYIQAPGGELFSIADARYMLTLIEGTQTWVQNLATRSDPERIHKIQRMLDDAHSRLHQRMHGHGHQH